ncbi:hypothetical protein TNCV_1527541 [Trichonephila clavipes]|nr:hypothetical protein TNCV_1527541 [Trichonephila clavipes]
MTAQRYVHDILQPRVLPLIQRLPEAIFQQDIARPHTAIHECTSFGSEFSTSTTIRCLTSWPESLEQEHWSVDDKLKLSK